MDYFSKFFKDYSDLPERYLYYREFGRVKKYDAFAQVVLPPATEISASFTRLVLDRISETDFSDTPIDLQTLSTLLYYSAAELGERVNGQNKQFQTVYRAHPSGGAKYPLELYLCVDAVESLSSGVYHYRPDQHCLEYIASNQNSEVLEIKQAYGDTYLSNAACIVMFSYIKERNYPKYGTRGYKLAMLEAGHISQNIYLAAAGLDVKCNAVGGLDDFEKAHELVRLDGENETIFYGLALGK